jgi:hypothetical protein
MMKSTMASTCSSVVGCFDGHGSPPAQYTKCIAKCSMSRATLKATGRRHWATTHSVFPQRLPGQQQTKQRQKNVPKKLAILMATAVRRYYTARIAQ